MFEVNSISIIGCGGNGSILAEALMSYLKGKQEDRDFSYPYIWFMDGDIVEEKNIRRQNFTIKDLGFYKCDVLRRRLGLEYNVYNLVGHIPFFLTDTGLSSQRVYNQNNQAIFLCVDNVEARLLVWKHLKDDKNVRNFIMFDLGNSDYYGQVTTYYQEYIRTVDKYLTLGADPRERYPNYSRPQERVVGCADRAAEVPQTITANYLTATYALNNFIQFMEKKTFYGSIEWATKEGMFATEADGLCNIEEAKELLTIP